MARCSWMVLLLLGLAATLAAAQPGTGTMTEDFDTGRAEGWQLFGGATVTQIGRGTALVIDGDGFAVWPAAQVADFTMQVALMAPQEGGAQINFRMGGEPPRNGEYQVRFEDGRTVTLMRMQAGQEQILGGGEAGLRAGKWVQVEITATGGQFQVSLDGRQVLSATDPQPLVAGAVGFGGFGGQAAFDAITITGMGGMPTQPSSQPLGGPTGGGEIPGNTGGPLAAYLRLDDVQGDSTAEHFQGWIELQHYEFSLQNQAMAQISPQQPTTVPLVCTKLVDRSSPILRQAVCSLRGFGQAELVVRFSGSVMMHTLQDVTIASIEGVVLDAQGQATETLVLTARSVRWELRQIDAQGNMSQPIIGGWNFSTNSPVN